MVAAGLSQPAPGGCCALRAGGRRPIGGAGFARAEVGGAGDGDGRLTRRCDALYYSAMRYNILHSNKLRCCDYVVL